MHNNMTRARSKAVIVSTSFALSIAFVIALCIAIYVVSSHAAVPHVLASTADSGAISSSPSSGPVGTTVSVSGSGWSQADGTPVSFGYIVNSSCAIVSDAQNGSFSAGAFSGWLRWPSSTPLGTYTVCAIISGSAQILTAGSFTVLSTTPPQVSIAPSALQENRQATITATNFLPSGTSVSFYWATTGGNIVRTIGGATSNGSGTALFTFSVPITTLGSGQYLVEAEGGGGQPSALFSSTNFTYTAPVVQPSPTSSPKPSPSPSPTQNPTQTATPTVTASATARSSPTAGSTPTGVPTQFSGGAGVTPTTATNGSASPTATTGHGTSSQSNNIILIGAIIGSLAVLIALMVFALLRRRKQTQQLAKLRPAPPAAPLNAGQHPGQPMPGASPVPGQFTMPGMIPSLPQPGTQAGSMAAQAGQYAAVGLLSAPPAPPQSPSADYGPVQANAAAQSTVPATPYSNSPGYTNGNGQNGQNGQAPMQAPLPYRSLLRPMTPPPEGPLPQNGDGNGMGTAPIDPALDAMRREAQVGLYVAPVPRGGNGGS